MVLKKNPNLTLETSSQQIAMRLRVARKAAGFKTEKSFAKKYKIPLTTYSQHETGKRKMAIEVLLSYCQKLKADLLWLLTGKPSIQIRKKDNLMNVDHSNQYCQVDIDSLKKILLLAKSVFPKDDHLFSRWMEQCIAAWASLSSQ